MLLLLFLIACSRSMCLSLFAAQSYSYCLVCLHPRGGRVRSGPEPAGQSRGRESGGDGCVTIYANASPEIPRVSLSPKGGSDKGDPGERQRLRYINVTFR